jgi:hypothetical protein
MRGLCVTAVTLRTLQHPCMDPHSRQPSSGTFCKPPRVPAMRSITSVITSLMTSTAQACTMPVHRWPSMQIFAATRLRVDLAKRPSRVRLPISLLPTSLPTYPCSSPVQLRRRHTRARIASLTRTSARGPVPVFSWWRRCCSSRRRRLRRCQTHPCRPRRCSPPRRAARLGPSCGRWQHARVKSAARVLGAHCAQRW